MTAHGVGEVVASEVVASEVAADRFDRFYRLEADRVHRALSVTLGDVHVAREATDEAMARAWGRWSRVGSFENPGGWVYRVGLNWATSRWRKLRREHPLAVDEVGPAVTEREPAESAAILALAQIPIDQRAVVVCRVLLQFSTAETATALGVAEGTVKSRLSRALLALRTRLAAEEER